MPEPEEDLYATTDPHEAEDIQDAAIVVHEAPAAAPQSFQAIKKQVDDIQQLMASVMKEDTHYGNIPGCGDKPVLLQAGAQKLALFFNLRVDFEMRCKEYNDGPLAGHREYTCKTTIYRIGTNDIVVKDYPSACSTLETKYRYTKAEATVTNRPVTKAYWDARRANNTQVMEQEAGGKGFTTKKLPDGRWFFATPSGERAERDNIHDVINTVAKMCAKRGYVGGVLAATGSSDIFTQDMEEGNQYPGGMAQTAAKDSPRQPMSSQEKVATSQPKHQEYRNPNPTYAPQQPKQEQQYTPPPAVPVAQIENKGGQLEAILTPIACNVISTGKKKNGKEWTRYGVDVAEPANEAGEALEFKCFDGAAQECIENAIQNGNQCIIRWKVGQWGPSIDAAEDCGPPPGAATSQPPTTNVMPTEQPTEPYSYDPDQDGPPEDNKQAPYQNAEDSPF